MGVMLNGANLQSSGRSPREQVSTFGYFWIDAAKAETFEGLASCFAFRCSASLDMRL